MPERMYCSECGSPLPTDVPQELCPRCLMKLALDSTPDESLISAHNSPQSTPTVPGHFDADRTDLTHALFAHLGDTILSPGQHFGEYHIQRLLGKGGMGEVYEAFHAASGRWVALKVLNHALSSDEDRKRFLREGRLAASVNHPHCVYVFGSEEIEGIPVIIMELAPSGTVNQAVKRTGPPLVERTIEMANQIIAGLEAAQAAGVLHRDIKPSNCFLNSQGQVKIGDFGLSITTLARDQSQLTLTGSFIGTPVFASPEQLRGSRLDVRSDIYSLGVTLYYMLTGAIPFEAQNMVQLVAMVLEKQPAAPSSLRPEIPKALSQVVLRCIEKSPEKRFASYAALRQALLPFGPGVPSPASPIRRMVAGVIDNVALSTLLFYPLVGSRSVFTGSAFTDVARNTMDDAFLTATSPVQIAFMALSILYYTIAEGHWGATPGKACLRLRVVNGENRAPGIWRAMLRAMTFLVLPTVLTQIPVMFFPINPSDPQPNAVHAIIIFAISVVVIALMFSTMRARNGYAAIQDLASKTRVVLKPSFVTEHLEISARVDDPTPAAVAAVGPYAALSPLPDEDGEYVIPGFDPVLRRPLWLHMLPKGAPPLLPQRRDIDRPGRLRWINGLRTPDSCWDAYEAPEGRPFLELLDRPQPWSSVRRWMLDLAEELCAASEDHALPTQVDLGHIWITPGNRAKLLDFPPVGAARAESRNDVPCTFDWANMQQFLLGLARAAIFGSTVPEKASVKITAALRLPAHAVELLAKLEQGTFDDACTLAANLKSTISLRTEITWRNRLASVAPLAILPVLYIVGISILASLVLLPNFMATVQRPELQQLAAALHTLETDAAVTGAVPEAPSTAAQDKALAIYVAGKFRKDIADPALRSNMFSILYQGSSARRFADRAVADYPAPTEQETAAATAQVQPVLDDWVKINGMPSLHGMMYSFIFVNFALVTLIFGIFSPIFALSAFLTRGGFLIRAAGIAVVEKNGRQVSRRRALCRSLIAWAPGWLLFIGFFFVRGASIYPGSDMVIALALFVVLFFGAIYTVIARRSIQDRLAGTYLAPL